MAGQASGGQTLTPNPNVNAPAGFGGDQWGANGGGITPYQTSDNVNGTQSRAQTATNYKPPASPPQPLGQQLNVGALSELALDSSIASGGNNQG